MTVSIMESGAGSVGVSARPAFPMTGRYSGNCLMRAVLDLHQLLRVGHRNAGQGGGHVQAGAFVERGMNSEPSLL